MAVLTSCLGGILPRRSRKSIEILYSSYQNSINVINQNIRRKFYIIRTISSDYRDIFNIPRSFISKLFPFVRRARTFVVNYHRNFYILHEIFRQTSISVRIQCLTFPLIRDTICMNYDRNRKTTFRRTSDLQIQYFERLNPEMECIYLLERRYQGRGGCPAQHPRPARLSLREIQYPDV